MTLSPQTVLITGGAIRIGRSIALHMAQQGWSVAIHYRESSSQAQELADDVRALGVQAVIIQADFGEDFDAAYLIEQAASIGPVSCLINNAAIIEKDGLSNLSSELFHRHMQINCYAPLKLIQAFAAHHQTHPAENACIINLSDGTYGWSMSSKFLSYALSKSGLNALTDMLAHDLAPQIRINTIGLAPTLPNENDPPGLFERHAERSPMQRTSTPEEVCRTIDYLLSASNVTGQHILLTGGLHCHS